MRLSSFWFGRGVLILVMLVAWPEVSSAENYAFLVAVQDYNVKDLKPLQFTRNDILAFAKILRESGFKEENIVLMTDKSEQRRYDAEAEKIRKQFDLLLSGVRDQDTLIVAFSGHGVQFEGDDKNNYYCPLDADLDDAKRTRLIALSEIYDKLKQCPAEKKLLLVDACRNDPLSVVKKARQTVHLKSVTRPQTEPVPKGIVAWFSCAAGQESYEWPDLKHGVFFHHVLEGWDGAAVDGDSKVTLPGLMAYATQKTQTFARLKLDSAQTPEFKSDFTGTWVLRKVESAAEPEFTNGIGMKLRLIPKGEFTMGSPESEKDRRDSETQHKVRITKVFYLGKHEVTQGEWKAVMGTEPWKGKEYVKEGDDYPAVYVSWEGAVDFCKKLSLKEGKTYRLPTEAEWEHACRGGKKTRYHFGDDDSDLKEYAWYDKNAWDIGEKYAHRVGLKNANPYGLHDMHGNVWEWCSDWYDEKYYANSPSDDPQGAESGKSRVLRGGSWLDLGGSSRSGNRFWYTPGVRYSPVVRDYGFVGFRVAVAAPARTR